ncbi:MAG: XisI protein [Cyanobacteriota bacterium]|nr:XisI protein [Cyanobacteriota bacterium]
MEKLEKYRNYIKKILTEYHEWASGSVNLNRESCLVFDEIHDQYFWLFMGWEGKKKIRNIQVHIRIKNEKIYIEEDWTEAGIAAELLTSKYGLNSPPSYGERIGLRFKSPSQFQPFSFFLRLRENVSKKDIVLAFHDLETRKLTEFAVV